MALVLQVSNSEMRAYLWCQRNWMLAYHFGYTLRPDEERPVGDAKLGTKIHLALELYYGYQRDPLTVIKFLYDRDRARYPMEWDVDRLNKEQDLALAMLEGYHDWVEETGADEGLTVISVEDDLTVPSLHPEVLFRAKLDQRIMREHDGARLFIDHKTTGSFENTTKLLQMDPQMRFYALLDAIDAKRSGQQQRVDGGVWNMLRRSKRTARAKPPFYRRDEIRFNRQELVSTWYRANSVVSRIVQTKQELTAGTDHRYAAPPNPGHDCLWRCQFVKICPMFDDGSNVQAALDDQYVKHDPYDYYESEAQVVLKELGA